MAETIWELRFNESSAERAGKKAGQAQNKEVEKQQKKGDGAFAGGFVGSILGNLLTSVKQLFDPLTAIATLLVAALFPILKPFLILFIKVGMLLYNWLTKSISGLGGTGPAVTTNEKTGNLEVSDSLKSGLFILGAAIVGISAVILGAGPLLAAAFTVLGGLIISKIGTFFIESLLNVVKWFDEIFGTNLLSPLVIVFEGISNIFNGLWNMLKGLLTLDFAGVWEGFKQMSMGVVQAIVGVLWFFVELLKGIFKSSLDVLKQVLNWVWDLIKTTFSKSIEVLSSFGTWILEGLKSILETSLNVLSDIGTWIKDKIKSMFSIFGGGSKSVDDAIITPNGDIIRTNPSDYLIATKNPGSLGGFGGSSGEKAINVNISGGLITEDVARQIGRIIQREINYGGGF